MEPAIPTYIVVRKSPTEDRKDIVLDVVMTSEFLADARETASKLAVDHPGIFYGVMQRHSVMVAKVEAVEITCTLRKD